MESDTKIFETDWNVIVGLGVKCDTMWIQKRADCRHISSPFDNMETTCGLTQCADLLKTEFLDYWEDINDWQLVSYAGRKGIRNKKYFDLYYPHFEYKWYARYMRPYEFKTWKKGRKSELTDPIFNGFKKVFGKRQQRLISILKEKNNILFLRIDAEEKQKKITYENNQQSHVDYFMETVTNAYPNSQIGFLYYYMNTPRYKREFTPSELIHFHELPFNDYGVVWDYVVPKLKEIKLLPRNEIRGLE